MLIFKKFISQYVNLFSWHLMSTRRP